MKTTMKLFICVFAATMASIINGAESGLRRGLDTLSISASYPIEIVRLPVVDPASVPNHGPPLPEKKQEFLLDPDIAAGVSVPASPFPIVSTESSAVSSDVCDDIFFIDSFTGAEYVKIEYTRNSNTGCIDFNNIQIQTAIANAFRMAYSKSSKACEQNGGICEILTVDYVSQNENTNSLLLRTRTICNSGIYLNDNKEQCGIQLFNETDESAVDIAVIGRTHIINRTAGHGCFCPRPTASEVLEAFNRKVADEFINTCPTIDISSFQWAIDMEELCVIECIDATDTITYSVGGVSAPCDQSSVDPSTELDCDCGKCSGRPVIPADINVQNLVSDCENGLEGCPGDIRFWNTSLVTDMNRAFLETDYNQSLVCWDVSSVRNMTSMFANTTSFNQNIQSWDVSSVLDMSNMFYGASAYNQSLNEWNTSNVTTFTRMFSNASSFNQRIFSEFSSTTDISFMFEAASSFNRCVDDFLLPVPNINDANNQRNLNGDGSQRCDRNVRAEGMFKDACDFNAKLNNLRSACITDMSEMFKLSRVNREECRTSYFNRRIDDWDVTSVTSMKSMFEGNQVFDRPLQTWHVANVEDMSSMFSDAGQFNQPIALWDVSSVEDTTSMFTGATNFNQPIDQWDVSLVDNMSSMFAGASSFNQCILTWANKTQDITTENMFSNSGCPSPEDPDPNDGPWCQDVNDLNETCSV